jgi:outer membrane receptor protein involved in Fe transport
VYLSQQLQPNNPLAYVFFTQNAAKGENYGVEAEGGYDLSARWRLSGSAAGLRTRYSDVGEVFSSLDIDGRAQPFAPNYQAAIAIEYRDPRGWFARLDSHAQGSFYYYTSDAQTSKSYHLENFRLGYQQNSWTASLWVRNLFDERYAQNGFYFGLIPPNFPTQAFLQLGDPRQIGVTVRYDLPAVAP